MPNFSYNNAVPDAPNNPSQDQPTMKQNTLSIDQLLAIDHVSFNEDDGGTHDRVTFSDKNAQGAQTDPSSVAYTASGSESTNAQLIFKNADSPFLVNAIRAFGVFTTVNVNGAVTIDNGYNVASIVSSGLGFTYTITLSTTAIPVTSTTANTLVITDINTVVGGVSISVKTVASNVITFTMNTNITGKVISFVVIQA